MWFLKLFRDLILMIIFSRHGFSNTALLCSSQNAHSFPQKDIQLLDGYTKIHNSKCNVSVFFIPLIGSSVEPLTLQLQRTLWILWCQNCLSYILSVFLFHLQSAFVFSSLYCLGFYFRSVRIEAAFVLSEPEITPHFPDSSVITSL